MLLEDLIRLDEQVFLFLNGLGTSTWDGFWLFMTKTRNSFPLYLLLFLLSYRFFGWKGTAIILVAVTLLITCTDQLSNFFKYGVQRLRPCHDPDISGVMRLVKSYCGGKYAFFSAHAANSFAIASFFTALFFRRWPYFTGFLGLWALFVAYSRIYIGVHFPLDVIVGALVGSMFGWVFAKLYIFALHKIGA